MEARLKKQLHSFSLKIFSDYNKIIVNVNETTFLELCSREFDWF